jgi:hypothetical protein
MEACYSVKVERLDEVVRKERPLRREARLNDRSKKAVLPPPIGNFKRLILLILLVV